MSAQHDTCYKLLFSCPEVIGDLLRGFVPGNWLKGRDFETLERIPSSYVTDDMRQRASDVVWRLKVGGDWVYLYVLIEFQSTVDRHMAMRVLNYVTLLKMDLARGGNLLPNGQFPPVLPIVMYNGDDGWTAHTDIAELTPRLPEDLVRYQPRFEYLLIDASQYDDLELSELDNLVAAVFRFEHPPNRAAMLDVVDWLRRKLANMPELAKTFTRWLAAVGSRAGRGNLQLFNTDDLLEARMSLESVFDRWKAEYREEGLQEGLQEGLEQGLQRGLARGLREGREQGLCEGVLKGRLEGIQEGKREGRLEGKREGRLEGKREGKLEGKREGEAKMLAMQLTQRFGELPDAVLARINAADIEQLELWVRRVLIAQHLADVFER